MVGALEGVVLLVEDAGRVHRADAEERAGGIGMVERGAVERVAERAAAGMHAIREPLIAICFAVGPREPIAGRKALVRCVGATHAARVPELAGLRRRRRIVGGSDRGGAGSSGEQAHGKYTE